MPVTEQDPFLGDKDFDVPLASNTPTHVADLGRIAEEHPEFQQGLEEFTPPAPASAEHRLSDVYPSVPLSQTPPLSGEDQPEVYEVDGGTVTLKKAGKGWEATLEPEDGGNPEVFRAQNKNDLLVEVLRGKLNATRQIRKLNKKIKLSGVASAPEPAIPVESVFQPKQLSANDLFEIKTAADSDLDKAFSLRFQKKYGMTEDEFVSLVHSIKGQAEKGEEAYEELTVEGVSKSFLEANKETYYPYAENGEAIMRWLCKHKLRRAFVEGKDDFGTISGELLKRGLYTVANLEEAMEDLQDSGLLAPPPQPEAEEVEEEIPVPVRKVNSRPVPEPTPPSNTRIVRETRRPRGGLGIRPSAAATHVPAEPTAPSVEDLDNASTEDINALFAGVRREAFKRSPNHR